MAKKEDEKMSNGDMMFGGILVLFLIGIWAISKRFPTGTARDRKPPLPVNQYTSGSAHNGMDVRSRVNFQQQPVGGSSFS